MTKQHFIWFANYIRTAPLSDADKQKLATMAIAAGARFNPRFNIGQFLKAAGLEQATEVKHGALPEGSA